MHGIFSLRNLWMATILGVVATGSHDVMASVASKKQVVSHQMAVPLKKAELFMKQGKYAQANAELRKAQALPHPTAYEHDIIEKVRVALAIKQNDLETASNGYESLIKSSLTTNAEKIQMRMAQSSLAYRARHYAKAIQFIQYYFAEGGNNPHMTTLLVQSYFLNNNCKEALQIQQKQIDDEVKHNQIPAESQWQIMASCQEKFGDQNGLRHSYIELATHYPKAEYWGHVMNALTSSKGLSPEIQLEVARLRYDAGLLKNSEEYMDMAEIAMQSGLPHLGLKILSEGYSKGVLGMDQNTSRVIRLRTFIQNDIQKNQPVLTQKITAAENNSDGKDLLMIGYDQVFAGNGKQGLVLMQNALTKKLPSLDEAKLHYAMAEREMNQFANAVQTLNSIQGQGVIKELADLWRMRIQAKKN